ncbi:MAG: family 10 glycosylhydrolase, partial [Candidatus Nealsonbacteria bacterium]|nr:family 10 glycosylhydrolase [Candidatus Nealsonbacteria bacterium]
AAGFNMVLPNMLWGGQAHYASDVLPRSATFRRYGDQIEQCVRAAKRHGLEVHVWKVNYNLSGAPAEFVEKIRREGRLQMTADGQPHPWLCPSHPENQRLEVESMLEVARKYPVAGLHFDYIRYPGRESCYCDGCRERFEAASGRKVANWPGDCHRGSRRNEYNDWRCRQITTVVAAMHREGKRLRPELKISAAVFGSYPACRESVAQDWPKWIEAGYLDFVCPMDYTASDLSFSNLVENQMKLVGGRIPVYPGIGATATRISLSPDRVVGQIHHARRLGAAGFTIFNFHQQTAATIIPGVGLGAGVQKAVLPHNDK